MSNIDSLDPENVLRLNGQTIVRRHSAKVRRTTTINGKSESTCVAFFFSTQYVGPSDSGNLKFRMLTTKRLLLDEKDRPIFKPGKMQKMALVAAELNDDLLFEIDREYRPIGILNSNEVRSKWPKIKRYVEKSYQDLGDMIADFEWQLQDENIQQMYRSDNFFNFFFANLFYQPIENGRYPSVKKTLSNLFGNLNVPIVEGRQTDERHIFDATEKVVTHARLDGNNQKFPLAKMNLALGELIGEAGVNHDMDFTYEGFYLLKPVIGLVTEGTLKYALEIGEVYKNITSMNFKLKNDER